MSGKVKKFELDSKSLKVKELLNKDFLELKIKAISTANPNRNGSHFTKESLEKAIPTFYNKPILGSFSVQQDDFRAHEGDLNYDDDFEQYYYDYTDEISETPLGLIRGSDEVKIYTDKKDGLDWIEFTCAIWVKYNYKQVKKLLKSKNGNKKISVEVEVNDSETDDNGIEHIKDFNFSGVTILGDKYETGIADANMTILDMIDNAVFQKKQKALNFAYNSLDNNNAESLDFKDQGSNKKNSPGIENEDPEESISMENSKKGGEDNPMKKEKEAKLNNEQEFASEDVCPDCGKDPCECESKETCAEEDVCPDCGKNPCECEAKAECAKEEEDPEAKETCEKEEEPCNCEKCAKEEDEKPEEDNKEEESCDSMEKCEKDPEEDDKEDNKEEDMSCSKFAVNDSIIQAATDVMASYQNANKWLDIIKEMLFTDLGCVFFSSYVHTLAHTMPGRFDRFGDILHTVNIKIPYPATEYIPNEVNNVGEAFNSVFMILDSIKFNLNNFIKATDDNYHGMACAAEALLNEIEEEYVPLYKMQKAYESSEGDLIKFDKWINQYVNNRDKLVESLNTFSCGEGCENETIKCDVKPENGDDNDPDDDNDDDKDDDQKDPKGEKDDPEDKDKDGEQDDEDDNVDKEAKCSATFDVSTKPMDPNAEPTDEQRNVDEKSMEKIIADTVAPIRAPEVDVMILGEDSTIHVEVGKGPNGELAEVIPDDAGAEGKVDVKQPDDSAKEDVFSAKTQVFTVEIDGEKIDINALLEKYNKLVERFEELSQNVKVREAQDLAKFGEDFINSDTDVDEEARKEFVEKVNDKCEKFELLSQDEVKDFAKSLLAMYYYENMVSKKNKEANFSVNIQEPAHKESQASNNKLKDAINKLNHVQ